MSSFYESIPKLARHFASKFEHKTRDDGSKYWSHSEPDSSPLYQLVYDAHGELMPDDYIYEFVVDALVLFSECETESSCEDAIAEIEGDTYTSDLTKWFADHNWRRDRVNDAMKDLYSPELDVTEYIRYAQEQERRDVAYNVLRSLGDLVDNYHEENDE